ncbi:hypothetical protein B0H10DRAFT_1796384 [Mycena sp. CBHHK59/15]|nr:hypothetical protein B0H10DRAFT_1796384 [Mycena sp. CBHHK59/15]
MSSHPPSTPTTSARVASTLYAPDSFSPYTLAEDKDVQGHDFPPSRPQNYPEQRQPRSSVYRSLSWILGFKEKYSLVNCIIFGGALVGFCLARSITMNPSRTANQLVPGEWFWFNQPMYKANFFIHVYLTTIGGIFAILQFLPAIRRTWVLLHRLNGNSNPTPVQP